MSPPPSRVRLRTTALIVASSLFMEQLDSTVLSTALPTMARSFDVTPMHMSVALTSYMLSLAVFLPASGKVADRFGARNVFCAAIILFTIGSALCGQAPSLGLLVSARLLQGLGGAMMVPVGRLLLLRRVAKQDMVSAMAWFLVPALIGPLVGPPLGGLIVTHLTWRWIFYVNLPIGVIGLGLVLRFIDDVREPEAARFDWLGLVIAGTSLASLIYGLEIISRSAASLALALILLAVGAGSALLYFRHAKHHPSPILDMTLWRVPTFRVTVMAGSLTRISGGAMPFLLPLMMQIGFGLSADKSGLITFTAAAGSMAMKATAKPILRRFGFRRTLIGNAVVASLCIALVAGFRPDWPMPLIYGVLLVSGFFQSLQFTALNSLAYADIPAPQMSDAVSFYATMQQLMLSVGICVGAIALNGSMALHGGAQPGLADFSLAFLVVSGLSILASPVASLLPPQAGDEMAGREDDKVQHSGMR